MKKRVRVQWKSDEPSMTQQHLKDECDVNSILEKYRRTGYIGHVNRNAGISGDFSTLQDFKQNLDMVKSAYAMFESLPAHLRKRFANDPANLIEFVNDDSNYDEALKLGLVIKAVENQKPSNDDKTTINSASNQPAI